MAILDSQMHKEASLGRILNTAVDTISRGSKYIDEIGKFVGAAQKSAGGTDFGRGLKILKRNPKAGISRISRGALKTTSDEKFLRASKQIGKNMEDISQSAKSGADEAVDTATDTATDAANKKKKSNPFGKAAKIGIGLGATGVGGAAWLTSQGLKNQGYTHSNW